MRTQGGKIPNKTKELYTAIEKHFNITIEKGTGYRGICIQRETHNLPAENVIDSESETASTITVQNQ